MRPTWCSAGPRASSTASLVEERGSTTVTVARVRAAQSGATCGVIRSSRAIRSARWLPVSSDEGNGEAIIPFAADRLDRRGADARLRGQQFVEAAHALDVRIAARGVGHRAFAHDVIGDDQAAATGEFERPLEVIRIARLVG